MKKSFTAIHLCGKAFFYVYVFEKKVDKTVKNVTNEKKYQ